MNGFQMPPPDSALAKENHLPRILAVQTTVLVLTVLCVGLRLYVRIKMTKSMGRDDWAMSGAAVSLRSRCAGMRSEHADKIVLSSVQSAHGSSSSIRASTG